MLLTATDIYYIIEMLSLCCAIHNTWDTFFNNHKGAQVYNLTTKMQECQRQRGSYCHDPQ